MFNYKWYLKNGYPAKNIENHKHKVFTTFACGGGSSMGYKLAGYDVIAANDIDSKMAKVYKENHNPKYFFECPIKDLLNKELPKELYDIDILDGSPPCSTFSMAGKREKKWGKEYKFREGQSVQVLDDLFFQFIKLAKKLKPKVIIAENVKGLLAGNAKGYVLEIKKQLQTINYNVQIFLLNSATMGVPQKRERVFFICRRNDLKLKDIRMNFDENMITFEEVEKTINQVENEKQKNPLTKRYQEYWKNAKQGEPVGKYKAIRKVMKQKVLRTITAGRRDCLFHHLEPRGLTTLEYIACGSFPQDYNFGKIRPNYLIGMSVPPVMMAQISYQVYKQWLNKL